MPTRIHAPTIGSNVIFVDWGRRDIKYTDYHRLSADLSPKLRSFASLSSLHLFTLCRRRRSANHHLRYDLRLGIHTEKRKGVVSQHLRFWPNHPSLVVWTPASTPRKTMIASSVASIPFSRWFSRVCKPYWEAPWVHGSRSDNPGHRCSSRTTSCHSRSYKTSGFCTLPIRHRHVNLPYVDDT